MSHSRVPAKSHRAPHRRSRLDRVTLPPICDGEGVGVDCCGEAQRSGAKRPSGALGAHRMPQVDSAASRQRLGGGAQVHAPTKGVVTPLMYACQQSRETQVRELLAQKSDCVLLRDRTMKSALHYCVENSNPASAELVLAAAPELLDAPDQEGFTPLHLAVIAGNVGLVRFLLHKRADLTAIDNEKHSVVHWATVCGENEALEALLDAGATPSSPDIHGGYPIHYASQMCGANSEMGNDVNIGLKILKTLLARGVDVNVVDEDGRQPILWAASAGSADAVLSLVNAGSAVEAEDKDGLTALHCAASRGHTECLETLITLCGAEVNVIDANGCTALFYAVTLGHADCTQLLLNFGSDPNMQDRRGRTAAHCGAAKGQLETLKLLSAAGADLWKRNVRGDLPLHDAVQSGRRELVRWLLALRPDMITVANSDGRSGLHIAATANNVEMCRVLLDAQSFVNPVMRNPKGIMMTPLDSALVKENRGCAKYLQLHGGVPASKLTEEAAAIRGPQRATESQMDNLTPRPDSFNHLGLTPRGALNFDTSGATTPAIQPENLQIPPVDQTTQTPSEMKSDVKMVERGVSARGSHKTHKKGRSRKSPSTARSTPSTSDSEETADAKSEERGKNRSTRKHRGKRKSSAKRDASKSKSRDQKKSEDEQSDNLVSDDEDTTTTVKTEIELVSANAVEAARNEIKKEVHSETNSKESSKSEADEVVKKSAASEKELKEKRPDEGVKDTSSSSGKEAAPDKPKSEKSNGSEKAKVSEKKNGKQPKSRDPSPTKGAPSSPKREVRPPKKDASPPKRDASPPKRDPSPSKRDISPPKGGKARPKSGKKIEKQTSGSKTSEADTDSPPTPAGEQDIDQTGTNSNEKNKDVSRQNSDTTQLSVSSAPIIIIEESASVMVDDDEEENAVVVENKTEENKPTADVSKDDKSSAPETGKESASDTDTKQIGEETKCKESVPEDLSKRVEASEIPCEKIMAENSITLEKETAALVKNAIKDAQEASQDQDSSTAKEATETEQKVDEKKAAPVETLETKSSASDAETNKDAKDIKGKTDGDSKINAAPSSPKKDVELLDANKSQVKDEEKMCSAKSTANGVSYVIINDDVNKATSNGAKNKKMPPLKRKEKSIDKSDSAEKSDNGSKRASREVNKDESKRLSKELKNKVDDRSGSKSRENKSLSRTRKKSNEKSAAKLEKSKSVNEEDKNSSKKSSAQASLEEANPEEMSSDASERSKAADSGVMMAEHSLSDSPKSKHKSNKGFVKVIPENEENKELINGKPSQRVTPTILSKMNARNNRAQIEEDEKKAREIIRKRHEQSVVSVTQAVQVSTRKYQLERKIFQELLELKKLQIRAGKTNETILVKRAVDEYRKAGLIVGLRQYDGPYSFRSFEQYLYDQLQLLQNSSDARIIARLKPSDDVESLTTALKRSIPGTMHHSPAFCTLSTHRCNHATDAYTTVPVPNYVGRLPRTESFLPRIEAPLGISQSGKGNKLIMSPSRTLSYVDPRRPVTLELSHGGERQVIALPTERLDRSKRYYVTFTIKPGDGQPTIMPANIEDKPENKHKHATSL